jgi:sulfate permease, SulP family
MNFMTIRESWFCNVRGDILSGMTVALALIPEALSFAIIAGVNPMVSLYSAFIIAVTVSFFGGRQAMISSSTGSMSLLMGALVASRGVEYLFAATILTGVLQFTMGKLKLGKFMAFIPHPVMLGFVNALGIMIFMAQIPRFIGESWPMYLIVAGTVVLMFLLPRFIKSIPPALICIILMTIISVTLGIHVRTVGDAGTITSILPAFHIPKINFSINTLLIILPYSLSLSIVGLLESLLTAAVLDEVTETKSSKSKEMKGQGIANIIAGLFGGMAGCALIGQSIMNVKSGGKGRLSTFVSGAFFLILIMILNNYVKVVPMAVLVGVMIIVCIETMNLESLKNINKMPRGEALIMLITMVIMIYTHDLGKGVLAGVVMSALVFGWNIAHIKVKEHDVDFDSVEYRVYRIHGQMFFGTTTHFLDSFNYVNDPEQVIIDFKNAHIWDHSAKTAIKRVIEKYQKLNKSVSIVGLNIESHELMRV